MGSISTPQPTQSNEQLNLPVCEETTKSEKIRKELEKHKKMLEEMEKVMDETQKPPPPQKQLEKLTETLDGMGQILNMIETLEGGSSDVDMMRLAVEERRTFAEKTAKENCDNYERMERAMELLKAKICENEMELGKGDGGDGVELEDREVKDEGETK